MATEKQIAASQRNAQLSTGPAPESGKKTSRLNALRHGLTRQIEITDPEEKAAKEQFLAEIVVSLAPASGLEFQLALSVADGYNKALAGISTDESPSLRLLTIYEQRIHRMAHKNFQQLAQVQAARRARPVAKPVPAAQPVETAALPDPIGFVFSTPEISQRPPLDTANLARPARVQPSGTKLMRAP
jgi:hypothetical protein